MHVTRSFHPLLWIVFVRVYSDQSAAFVLVICSFAHVPYCRHCCSTTNFNNNKFIFNLSIKIIIFTPLYTGPLVIPIPIIKHQNVGSHDLIARRTKRKVFRWHFFVIYLRLKFICRNRGTIEALKVIYTSVNFINLIFWKMLLEMSVNIGCYDKRSIHLTGKLFENSKSFMRLRLPVHFQPWAIKSPK